MKLSFEAAKGLVGGSVRLVGTKRRGTLLRLSKVGACWYGVVKYEDDPEEKFYRIRYLAAA